MTCLDHFRLSVNHTRSCHLLRTSVVRGKQLTRLLILQLAETADGAPHGGAVGSAEEKRIQMVLVRTARAKSVTTASCLGLSPGAFSILREHTEQLHIGDTIALTLKRAMHTNIKLANILEGPCTTGGGLTA